MIEYNPGNLDPNTARMLGAAQGKDAAMRSMAGKIAVDIYAHLVGRQIGDQLARAPTEEGKTLQVNVNPEVAFQFAQQAAGAYIGLLQQRGR